MQGLGAGGRPRGPLPGLPGTGKTHLARRIVRGAAAGGRGRGAWGWARRPRTTGCAARCATAAASWVVEEVTQIDSGLACVALDRGVRFLLLGDFLQLPAVLGGAAATSSRRTAAPTTASSGSSAGCGWASPRRCPRPAGGEHPDVCLVISHAHRVQVNERENRRLSCCGTRGYATPSPTPAARG